MRLLLVNGNTTQAITDRATEAARLAAPAGVEIVGVTARFGANVVTTAPENLIAGHAVLEALAEHHDGFDAAILAISFDTALAEARELFPLPVHGITEAALDEAASLSAAIGVVIFGEASLPLYRGVFARHAASSAIAEVAAIDVASTNAYLTAERLDEAVLAQVARMSAAHDIGAAVICGAAVAGIAARLQPRCRTRLVDGVPAAVRAAVSQASAGPRMPAPARPALARSVEMTGVSAALAAAFGRG